MVLIREGYDPRKSRVSDEIMERWRVSPIDSDLRTVPGIGRKAFEKLVNPEDPKNAEKITSTFQPALRKVSFIERTRRGR
jgi:hypothetical protein